MKMTVDYHDFERAFTDFSRRDNFSNHGLRALFEYLEEYEQDTGEEIELDVVALCCEYSEEPLEDVLKNYSLQDLEELRDNTSVVDFDAKTGLVVFGVF